MFALRHTFRLGIAAAMASAGLFLPATAHADDAVPLNGLFAVAPGTCSGGAVTGSFFRMILPAGDSNGPFLSNSDSGCSDQTVTPLAPGTDGGLVSGSYQPQPAQAFDATGNAISGSVTQPVRFYGVGFATATNQVDPQTGSSAAAPQLYATGNSLSGDLSSLGVTWNNQVFNQGAPKPGGDLPGKTRALSGSIDPATGSFVVEWTSQIVGGPFNNFTGLWHLAGQYRGGTSLQAPAPVAPAVQAPPALAAPAVAPGAPAPAAPVAPGAPQPSPAATAVATPVATPAQTNADPTNADPALTARTLELPRTDHPPRWAVPVLVLLGLFGVALFFNAERIAGKKKS
ncbi:hypothetical protein [Antrihabitans cavernicola]|uniref:Uncharacterized protein n=1 Tax=Antrihabitans cavernicola TaxID=2495913 RepID=A0A5A7SEQ9_9NOCA|nr:hypothetical protein [Spelaeibacter cavernicola]KAA0022711.1 hypothetical protein FOY51_13615 [Spelaeibacter cavernicola]